MAAKKPRFTVTTPGDKSPWDSSTVKPKPFVSEHVDLAEALAEVLGYVADGIEVTLKARKAKA